MGLPETAVSRVSCAGWQPCLILDADAGPSKDHSSMTAQAAAFCRSSAEAATGTSCPLRI